MSDKDKITEDGAVELDESALGKVTGGHKWLAKDETNWKVEEGESITADRLKVNGFDGKGNDIAFKVQKS